MKEFLVNRVGGEPIPIGWDWQDLQTYAVQFPSALITVEKYSEAKRISLQQLRWWKGILLPALSQNGETISQWETRLKLAVLPDDFNPQMVMVDRLAVNFIPSVSILSCVKASILVEGSVAHCRDECGLQWVTLPDPLKRKT